ncbi:hypothetical protein NDN08_002359 [Rhodosorus marinus]|uniref:AAA+ ATPase domain-containing protein n=1 Tax=Rhodosorus marinus TaxID=101924 RepID=A0AAV8UTI4_9RHOD|nr:hypothetical protein NDN08_002359 [Rhodosorus marinus]
MLSFAVVGGRVFAPAVVGKLVSPKGHSANLRTFLRATSSGISAEPFKVTAPRKTRSPHQFVSFTKSMYVAHMNELAIRGLSKAAKDPVSELDHALFDTGLKHEENVLDRIKSLGIDVAVVDDNDPDKWRRTSDFIQQGREVIYQAGLRDDILSGVADFLLLAPGGIDWISIMKGDENELKRLREVRQSADFQPTYAVLEVKLSGSAKSEYVLQALCYADLVEGITGTVSDDLYLWLGGHQAPVHVHRNKFLHYFRAKRAEFEDFLACFDRGIPRHPKPDRPVDSLGPWTAAAKEQLKQEDALQFVAGIRKTQIERLNTMGITTMAQLAALENPAANLSKLQKQAELQMETKRRRMLDPNATPAYRVLHHDGARVGLASLPPESEMDIYFDLEGFPLYAFEHQEGLEYLFGFSDRERNFTELWAHDHAEEEEITAQFIREAHSRWERDPGMHIYHYGVYEITALKRIVSRVAGEIDRKFADMLEADVFVDLFRVVRHGLMLGEQSYSIKKVENLCGVSREEDDLADAQSSVGLYHRFRCSTVKEERRKLLTTIADYNRQDCYSLSDLIDWLRKEQIKEKIRYIPWKTQKLEAEGLSEEQIDLLNTPGACGASPQRRIADAEVIVTGRKVEEDLMDQGNDTLGRLVSFHIREGRPARAQFRQRLTAYDENDFLTDTLCIGRVRIRSQEAVQRRRSTVWRVVGRFDPDQPHVVEVGNPVAVLRKGRTQEDSVPFGTVRALEKGVVVIDITGTVVPFEGELALVSTAELSICSAPMREGILRLAQTALGNEESSCGGYGMAQNFVERRPPVMRGGKGIRSIVDDARNDPRLLADLVHDLEKSVLIIQGPPGSGKTQLTSTVIQLLARKGLKIAVSSNSHASIDNVLQKVAALDSDVAVRKVSSGKVTNDGDEIPIVPYSTSVQQALKKGADVVGATVFQISRQENIGAFDLLFIDEAGQVPLANFISMAGCAKSAVLVGDQRQLEMPIQGIHPAGSGFSCLEYPLGSDCVTVPKDLGLFLNRSYRMAPKICSFISGAMYDGRLTPHERTEQNSVDISNSELLTKRSGVQFVGHVGEKGKNVYSQAEVDLTRRVIKELLGRQFSTASREGELTEEDILIVAPYNIQVSALKKDLGGPPFRIGTVDKFQGQEAPVVIVNICSNGAEEDDERRGVRFALKKNRLNVGISRAQCLTVVIGSLELSMAPAGTIAEMELLSLYTNIMQVGSNENGFPCFDLEADAFRQDSLTRHLGNLKL